MRSPRCRLHQIILCGLSDSGVIYDYAIEAYQQNAWSNQFMHMHRRRGEIWKNGLSFNEKDLKT